MRTHTQTHTHILTHILKKRKYAACFLCYTHRQTLKHRTHLCKLSLPENIFIVCKGAHTNRLFHSYCIHTHTSCDLAQACPVCWQVRGTECVRNDAHTSSSRPSLDVGIAHSGEVYRVNSSRGMQTNNLPLLNNASAIKLALSHLLPLSL